MKTIAKFLTGLTVALLLFVGYYVWSSSLPAEVSVRVESASAYPEDFAAVQQMVQDGKPIEVKCHFCNTSYQFDTQELKEIRN